MKTEEELLTYLSRNKGGLILFDSLGNQRLINYDKNCQSLYYLNWSPRENSGGDREFLTFDKAIDYIREYKPELIDD